MAKKLTKQVRIPLRTYELLRRAAYKSHKPMTDILEEWATFKFPAKSVAYLRKQQTCKHCGKVGHRRATCPDYKASQ